ncbi:MAG: phosphatidylinositol mannoside acyltransferase [Actinomycetes bacterium]
MRGLYRAGWAAGAGLPEPAVRALLTAASRAAVRRDGQHVRQLRRNLEAATGAPVDDVLLRAAVASHLRNVYETLALPGWSRPHIAELVTTNDLTALRTARQTRGAVLALPHSGNWDLAGAWACLHDLPVSTVAEQLADPDFRAFTHFREGLGMEVWSHRDRTVMAALADAVRRGRVVCLLADRDLSGTGLPVRWGPHAVTMPAGPALLARRTGALLFPVVSTFTNRGMHLEVGEAIEPQPRPEGLQAMTQQVADVFAQAVAARPQDWHMLQPFFPAEEPA